MDTIEICSHGNIFNLKVGDVVFAFYPDYRGANIPPPQYKATVTRILGSSKAPYCEVSIVMPDSTVLVKIDSRGDERGVGRGWRIAEYNPEKEQQLKEVRQKAILHDKIERELVRAISTFNSKSPYIYVRHAPTEKTQALIDLLNELNKIVS